MTKLPTDKINGAPPKGGSFFDPPADLASLSRRQGATPLDFDELMASEEAWPADEDVDDFIAAVREWRGEGEERKLP